MWVPQKPGVYPFYCTDFCSALHQEMQGYVRVSAKGSGVPIKSGVSDRAATQQARAGKYTAPATTHEHGAAPGSAAKGGR